MNININIYVYVHKSCKLSVVMTIESTMSVAAVDAMEKKVAWLNQPTM